jgi:transcriptional regulator with XRE-family HTH domain
MSISPNDCKLVTIFAENLKRLRAQSGHSQEQLADLAGVHRTYIGMLERGEKNVTIYNIERIAGALNVEAHLLLKKVEGKR